MKGATTTGFSYHIRATKNQGFETLNEVMYGKDFLSTPWP